MTYNKPEIVTLSSPIKAVQGHDKVVPTTVLETPLGDYFRYTPAAYEADE